MKTVFQLTILIAAITALSSCSAPYSATSSAPKMLSAWTVTTIEPEGDIVGTSIPVPVFDDATISCLSTSNWSLADGGSGSYMIKPTGDTTCVSGNRRITWQIVNLAKDAHYFQFFRSGAPAGILADRFTTYILQIAQLTKTTMVLKYPVKYHDKTGNLVFTFSKGNR